MIISPLRTANSFCPSRGPAEGRVGKFQPAVVEHNILKGEFETNQQLYQKLLEHLKDATVSAGLRSYQHPRD